MWLEDVRWGEEIFVGDGIEWKEKLWCCAGNFNRIYCIDLKTFSVEKEINIDKIPNIHPFSKVIVLSQNLYFIPLYCESIVKYCLADGKIKFYKIDNLFLKNNKLFFISGCSIGKYLFLIPFKCKNIVRFNTENEQIDFLPLPEKNDEERMFIRRCVIKGNFIWVAVDGENRILEIDVEKMESKWICLSDSLCICDICMSLNYIYCLDTTGKVIIYNVKTNEENMITHLKSNEFGFIEISSNYLWFIPTSTNRITRFSKEKGVEIIEYPSDFEFSLKLGKNNARTFSNIYSNEFVTIIMPRCNNYLIRINKKNNQIIFDKITFSAELINKYKESFYRMANKYFLISERKGNLEWFLDFINQKRDKMVFYDKKPEIGSLIYQEEL